MRGALRFSESNQGETRWPLLSLQGHPQADKLGDLRQKNQARHAKEALFNLSETSRLRVQHTWARRSSKNHSHFLDHQEWANCGHRDGVCSARLFTRLGLKANCHKRIDSRLHHEAACPRSQLFAQVGHLPSWSEARQHLGGRFQY